jgi:hypothetical protein
MKLEGSDEPDQPQPVELRMLHEAPRRLDEARLHADNHQVEVITRSKMTDLLAGRYRIDSPLGAGGMGEVFLAHDIKLERSVAIKWLHPDHEQDLVTRERLRREALAAAALDHPFICKIFEVGDADGRTFIVMEYVEGETLQVAARRDLLPVRQIVDIAHELAQALETGRAVLDRTGLLGKYTFTANLFDTLAGLTAADAKDAIRRSETPAFTTLREQLGLKLDADRAAIEFLVIDSADKTPTAD